MPGDLKGGECLVLGDSIIRNVGNECPDIKVECFPGIRTEQLQRVIERRELGSPDSVVIHVGTNDLRRTGNLDYVMGDAYDLVNKVKTKFSASRVVLSGVLRREDVSWRRIGAVNDRLEWIAKTLAVTFVDTHLLSTQIFVYISIRSLQGMDMYFNPHKERNLQVWSVGRLDDLWWEV